MDPAAARPRARALSASGAASVATGDSRREWRLALLICAASGLARLGIAALTPLFPDETYYWEWSRHLAFGYFDHPPLVAWLVAAGRALFGDTPLGVRFGSVVAGTAAAVLLCAAARRLGDGRAAVAAAVIFAVMPLSAAGLVLATPDAPLLAAAAAVWYALLRVMEVPSDSAASLKWWAVAGVGLGLALASKYTGVLVPLAVLLAFAAYPVLRPRLREPGPYVATAIALLILLPVLAWNSRHDWISLGFQLRHGLVASRGYIVSRELELLGGQAGLVSPVLFGLCALAVWRAFRKPNGPPQRRLLATGAAVVFLFFAYSATRRRVEANWPALAYLPAILLLVSERTGGGRVRERRWLRAGVWLAAALTLVVYVDAFAPVLPVPARRDPAARAHGWDAVARAVSRAGVADSARTFVAADRYQDASELAFHLPGRPETFSLNLGGRANQYDLWPTFAQRARPGDALVLLLDDVTGTPAQILALSPHFASVARGEQVALRRGGDLVKNFRVWTLHGWRGTWLGASLRSRPSPAHGSPS